MTIDTPARILGEAERLFADGGYTGTSLASIARASGLGNAGLLHHFPSKGTVYRAVLESIAADLHTRSAAAVAGTDEPIDQLRGLVEALLGLDADRPTALLVIAREFLDRSGRIEEATTLPLAGVVAQTVAVIRAGQAVGAVGNGDPLALTAALHGALLHGVLGRRVYTRVADREVPATWTDDIVRVALSGVLDTT